MRVADAGNGDCGPAVNFVCPHCGYDDGWTSSEGLTADKRGRPCPQCNGEEEPRNG